MAYDNMQVAILKLHFLFDTVVSDDSNGPSNIAARRRPVFFSSSERREASNGLQWAREYPLSVYATMQGRLWDGFWDLSFHGERSVVPSPLVRTVKMSGSPKFLHGTEQVHNADYRGKNMLLGEHMSTGDIFEYDAAKSGATRDANVLPGAIGLEGSFDEHLEEMKEALRTRAVSTTYKNPIEESNSETRTPDVPRIIKKKINADHSKPKADSMSDIMDENEGEAGNARQSHLAMRKRKPKSLRKSKEMVQNSNTGTANGFTVQNSKYDEAQAPGILSTSDQISPAHSSGENMFSVPHPMNRKMEELQVTEGSGKMEQSAIRDAYRRLANAYLAPFSDGIKRQSFFEVLRRKTYSLTPPGANKGVQTILFQLINRKLYLMDPYEVRKNSKPFYRSRITELIWLLSEIVKEGNVPNTEILFAIHDCVQTVNKDHTYRGSVFKESNPTFTIVSCNFSDNIPFPMWEGDEVRGGLTSWTEKIEQYQKADTIPWKDKKEKAVFRGGNRLSMYFKNKSDANDHCHQVGRSRLRHIGEKRPEIFDVSLSGLCGGEKYSMSRLSESEHHNYKYILYAEGNCFWADRLNKQVFGPSAVIKQETPCGQFWEPLLKPMTHYIPTDFFFQNTADQVNWARENDEKVQAIVKNANEFASNFLSLNGIKTYVEVLIVEYTKLLTNKEIKAEKGSEDVTV